MAHPALPTLELLGPTRELATTFRGPELCLSKGLRLMRAVTKMYTCDNLHNISFRRGTPIRHRTDIRNDRRMRQVAIGASDGVSMNGLFHRCYVKNKKKCAKDITQTERTSACLQERIAACRKLSLSFGQYYCIYSSRSSDFSQLELPFLFLKSLIGCTLVGGGGCNGGCSHQRLWYGSSAGDLGHGCSGEPLQGQV